MTRGQGCLGNHRAKKGPFCGKEGRGGHSRLWPRGKSPNQGSFRPCWLAARCSFFSFSPVLPELLTTSHLSALASSLEQHIANFTVHTIHTCMSTHVHVIQTGESWKQFLEDVCLTHSRGKPRALACVDSQTEASNSLGSLAWRFPVPALKPVFIRYP